MVEQVNTPEVSSLANELEDSLTTLNAALGEAGRAVAAIRGNISRIAALAEVVSTMEEAMNLARRNLHASLSTPQQPRTPPLRSVPPSETVPQPDLQAPIREPVAEPIQTEAPVPPTEPPAPQPTAGPAELPHRHTIAHCFRLRIGSKVGSLDLKAVDGAVNEHPAVVDVALLDYDGRQATLKLWINGAADAGAVRDALVMSLRRRLGDEQLAEVRVDFEEGSAA